MLWPQCCGHLDLFLHLGVLASVESFVGNFHGPKAATLPKVTSPPWEHPRTVLQRTASASPGPLASTQDSSPAPAPRRINWGLCCNWTVVQLPPPQVLLLSLPYRYWSWGHCPPNFYMLLHSGRIYLLRGPKLEESTTYFWHIIFQRFIYLYVCPVHLV